jgi:ketosteroid isomerase-like protein
MGIAEIAADFAALCAAGQSREAARRHWAEDVVSIEPFPGDMAVAKGREAVFAKHDWWEENHEIHGVEVGGPWIHGDQFALTFALDVTPKGGGRVRMDEVGVYTVRGGKIVEERFFASPSALG